MSFADVMDPTAKPETTGLDKPSTATIETFDGFTYTLKIGKLSNDKYPVTFSIDATLPSQRTSSPNEKAEDKKKLDNEFSARKKTLEEKLAKEKKFEGRPFLLNKYSVAQLLKNRSELVKAPPTPTPSVAPGAPPPAPQRLPFIPPKRPFPRPGAIPRPTP